MPVRNLRDELKARKAARRGANAVLIAKCYARKEALDEKEQIITRKKQLVERREKLQIDQKYYRAINEVAEKRVTEAAERGDDFELKIVLNDLTEADELELTTEEELHVIDKTFEAKIERFDDNLKLWDAKLNQAQEEI
jgi:hypothetical protein